MLLIEASDSGYYFAENLNLREDVLWVRDARNLGLSAAPGQNPGLNGMMSTPGR